jgi:hypothetical protein
MAIGTFPRFKLYLSDGLTLIYEFDLVTSILDNQDPADFVEHTGLRGQGSIIIPGSDSTWDLTMSFILRGTDYEDITAKIETLITTIEKFTKYILKVDTDTGGGTKDYKLMRLVPFTFPLPDRTKRVKIQRVNATFRVDSWA